jgi:hypothetical protein
MTRKPKKEFSFFVSVCASSASLVCLSGNNTPWHFHRFMRHAKPMDALKADMIAIGLDMRSVFAKGKQTLREDNG